MDYMILKIVEAITLLIGYYSLKILPKPFKILVIYISVSFFTNYLMDIVASIYTNNYFVLHIYTPIELVFLLIIIFRLGKYKKIKQLTLLIIPFMVFWVVAKFTFESFFQIDNITGAVASGIIFISATYTILKVSLEGIGPIFKDPILIILLGILLYYGGILFVFAMSNTVFAQGDNQAFSIWRIHNVLHIIFNFACIYSFQIIEKNQRRSNQ